MPCLCNYQHDAFARSLHELIHVKGLDLAMLFGSLRLMCCSPGSLTPSARRKPEGDP